MTDKIIISNEEKMADVQLEILFSGPLSLLDPRHPAISEELQKQILYDRYHNKLIADGLETGHFFYDYNNDLRFQTKQPLYTFAGFIFEAFAVNVFNNNMRTIGKKAFSWCTNREQCKDDYIDQFKVIGTGFITTKSLFPNFYGPQSTFDLIFIKKNIRQDVHEPATVLGTTNQAGIQIKAITGSEETEIIEPLRTGRYSHVLTFLRHSDGVHSYTHCMEVLNSMHRRGVLGLPEKYALERRISHPEMFGIDQREVDDYYQYILHWYTGHANPDQFITEGAGLEIKGYKYSNGLLVPTD
ncbi:MULTISPECIES: hypothetical protein [Ralstonia solanacearum species complex]|uniref:Uncharacterized protein n=2 Tax=Ralstonia solanacearum TaxID=305 RepID=A0ABF7RFY3_RALSL|nr:hypothetical protein [Ralstonia solanacearum]ALF87504.1 hypothetical protein RSUY_11340 [Ralstonia solanacearum]MDN4065645.1 hypothetical protein [Ralstonia solanacearum]NUU73364.1 hypothetical protein [Ralstonia solanacearum]CEJ19931.1 hypothetical protein RSIPO_04933 [Ralstonia solanacearum IPO1609]